MIQLHSSWLTLLASLPPVPSLINSKMWLKYVRGIDPIYSRARDSDKEITHRSGIIDLIEGDDVMVDKGFLIQDLLTKKKAYIVIPPFPGPRGNFSSDEVSQTHEIARLRIHVERAIRRVKEYDIFDKVLPLSLSGSSTQLWTVCVLLTNFKGPLF